MRSFGVLLVALLMGAALSDKEPCFPPGSCTAFGAPVAVNAMPMSFPSVGGAAVTTVTQGGPQVILQSNAVDVETDGGFVVSLPTPPPPSPDLPDFAEDHPASSLVNRVIAHQRNKIALIEAKIATKKQALSDHDTWLEQAKRALERVKKQILETKHSRQAIKRNLKNLQDTRKTELKATKRAKLAKELEETRKKLIILNEQHAAVRAAKAAIQRKRTRTAKVALGLGKLSNWNSDKLKEKIQEFEDQDNELASIGQTPQNIRHIDTMLEDAEEVRMAEI